MTNESEDDAVPAFRDVIDVPLVVRDVRRSRKQVLDCILQTVHASVILVEKFPFT